MENRNLNQIVFVVMDNYEQKVLGVYNEYADAVQLAEAANKDFYSDDIITITPVLVDTININPDSRKLYYREQEVVDALQEEMDLALPYEDENKYCDSAADCCFCNSDDEEEEEYEEEEEEEDEEDNPDAEFFDLLAKLFSGQ